MADLDPHPIVTSPQEGGRFLEMATGFQAPVTFDELGVATEPRGMQASSVWFGGGRVGAHVEHDGTMEEIVYYGSQPMHRQRFFKVEKHSPYQKLFCPYLLIEDRAYQLEWEQTRVFPAGYVSRLSIPQEGVDISHSMIVLNDAIVYRIEELRNDHRRPLRLRLSLHQYLRHPLPDRMWGDWRKDVAEGAMVATVIDRGRPTLSRMPDAPPENPRGDGYPPITTWVGVGGSRQVRGRLFLAGKHHFESDAIEGKSACMFIVFGHKEADFKSRVQTLRKAGDRTALEAVARWENALKKAPAVSLRRPAVESLFRQMGLILDMLKPAEIPGAMRAAVGHYWVWGWDTIAYIDAELLCGHAQLVREAMDFYRRTAHPVYGVGHQFSETMQVTIPQAMAAQGGYVNMLYEHLTYTGDMATLREFYPFAVTMFQRTLTQGKKANLFRGSALWPDHPRFAGQSCADGEVSPRDLSIFNNSIFYQSTRAMEVLAGLMNDVETARACRETWIGLEASFRDLFWDEKRDYWIDSLDAETLEPRNSYPAHAISWLNPFARDLVAEREEACAKFLTEEHVCFGGIRPYPKWDQAFNADGNQLAQWYPVTVDLFFLKMMGATGRQEMVKRWLGWVEEFWRQYTVPEGLTLEAENDGPHRPDCPGGKQPFSGKAWYLSVISAIAGIDIDYGGVTICPGLDEPVNLVRIPFRGRELSFSTDGAGIHVARINVNGIPLVGSYKIPADHCEDVRQQVTIGRTSKSPNSPVILSADGAILTKLTGNGRAVSCHVKSPATVRIWIQSPFKPKVLWNGVQVDVTHNQGTGRASVLLVSDGSGVDGELAVG